MVQNILLLLVVLYTLVQLIKSWTVGPAFSITKWIRYREDYKKWYKFKQTYLPPKKRVNFSKGKRE